MGNVTVPAAAKAAAAPIDEQQKQAMLEQLRSQYGNISEKQVEFISGPGGVSTRFKPPIVEVLKNTKVAGRPSRTRPTAPVSATKPWRAWRTQNRLRPQSLRRRPRRAPRANRQFR